MSIFGDFLSPMRDVFVIEKGGYRCKDSIKHCPVTCSEMMGWDFRDPGTIPLARGTRLPRELLSDFVLDEDKFDCLVDGKRRWVKWSDIFDDDVNEVADIFKKFALDGDFDKSLPMWVDDEPLEEHKPVKPAWHRPYESSMWSTTPIHNTTDYWSIVAQTIAQNIKKHIRPNVVVDIKSGIAFPTWNDFRKNLGFQITIISIDGQKCCWLNTMYAAMDMLHKTHWAKFMCPSIGFMYEIIKKSPKESPEDIDINISFR